MNLSSSGSWLDLHSPEYDLIHYHLSSSVAHLGVVDRLKVWKIDNPSLYYKFERKCSGMLRLHGWKNTEEILSSKYYPNIKNLGGNYNSIEEICTNGFYYDKKLENGLQFSTGSLNLEEVPVEEGGESKEYCFFFLDLAVGRSFVCENNESLDLNSLVIPQGYDSLYFLPSSAPPSSAPYGSTGPQSPLSSSFGGAPHPASFNGGKTSGTPKLNIQEYQNISMYHSLPQPPLPPSSSATPSSSLTYSYSYFIQDMNQVCPKYIVRFHIRRTFKSQPLTSPTQPQSSKNFLSTSLTSSTPVAAAASAASIANKNMAILMADSLPQSLDVSYLDPITFQPVAYKEKGEGAGKDRAESSLQRSLPIEKIYSQVSEEFLSLLSSPSLSTSSSSSTSSPGLSSDPLIQTKSQWIKKNLNLIEDKVREINLNYAEIITSIDSAVKKVKKQIEELIKEKLDLCLSLEFELKRENDELTWLSSTAKKNLLFYQQLIIQLPQFNSTATSSIDVQSKENIIRRRKLMYQFIKLSKQYTTVKNSLSRLNPTELNILNNIHGDIKVNPNIQLFTDPFFSSSSSSSSTANVGRNSTGPSSSAAVGIPPLSSDLFSSDLTNSILMTNPKLSSTSNGSTLTNLLSKSINLNEFSSPITTSSSFLPSFLQNIINDEMDLIQNIITEEAKATSSSTSTPLTSLRLPAALTNSLLDNEPSLNNSSDAAISFNDRFLNLPLHSMLESIRGEILKDLPHAPLNNDEFNEENEKDEADLLLQRAFSQALPRVLNNTIRNDTIYYEEGNKNDEEKDIDDNEDLLKEIDENFNNSVNPTSLPHPIPPSKTFGTQTSIASYNSIKQDNSDLVSALSGSSHFSHQDDENNNEKIFTNLLNSFNQPISYQKYDPNIAPSSVCPPPTSPVTKKKSSNNNPLITSTTSAVGVSQSSNIIPTSPLTEDHFDLDDNEKKKDEKNDPISPLSFTLTPETQQQQNNNEINNENLNVNLSEQFESTNNTSLRRKITSKQETYNEKYNENIDGNNNRNLNQISMKLNEIGYILTIYKQFLLTELTKKKRSQISINKNNKTYSYLSLKSSQILQDDEIEPLYFSLPFFSITKPPSLKLVYTIHTHRRNLDDFYARMNNVSYLFLSDFLFFVLINFLFLSESTSYSLINSFK